MNNRKCCFGGLCNYKTDAAKEKYADTLIALSNYLFIAPLALFSSLIVANHIELFYRYVVITVTAVALPGAMIVRHLALTVYDNLEKNRVNTQN